MENEARPETETPAFEPDSAKMKPSCEMPKIGRIKEMEEIIKEMEERQIIDCFDKIKTYTEAIQACVREATLRLERKSDKPRFFGRL